MSDSDGNVIDLATVRAQNQAGKPYDRPPVAIGSKYAESYPINDLVSRAAALNIDVFLYGTDEQKARECARCGFIDFSDFEMSMELLAILQGAGVVAVGPHKSSSADHDFDIGA